MLKKIVQRWLRDHPERIGPVFDVARLAREFRPQNLNDIRVLAGGVYIGEQTVLCRVLGRYKMYVDSQDISISSHLMIDGVWEIWVTEAMALLIKPGMKVVDIGANLGYYTLMMADLVGPKGKVFAFEPNPPIAGLLNRSVVVNGFADRVTVHAHALSDTASPAYQLFVPANHPGGAFVLPVDPADAPPADLIATYRLDSYPDILDADFIKIDAEAAEESIWRGMAGLIERGHPLTIFLEFTSCRYSNPAGFLATMENAGFALAYIDIDNGTLPITASAIMAWPATDEVMLVLRRE